MNDRWERACFATPPLARDRGLLVSCCIGAVCGEAEVRVNRECQFEVRDWCWCGAGRSCAEARVGVLVEGMAQFDFHPDDTIL